MPLLRFQRKHLRDTHAELSYELLTAVAKNSRPIISCNVTPCSLLPDSYLFLDLLFGHKDGGKIFLRNVGEFLPDYTT
jgi:hypothetical protein